jgi:hypothetical protein
MCPIIAFITLVGARQPLGFRNPTLAPTVCELKRTLTECRLKKDLGRRFWLKAHPMHPESKSPPLLKQPSKPHTYPQTVHMQPSTEFHVATTKVRRPEDPMEQPTTQAEVLTMNTSAQNTMPPPPQQHQTIKAQEDLQQDSKEEIEAVIKDELVRLH